MKLKNISKTKPEENTIFFVEKPEQLKNASLNKKELDFLKRKKESGENIIHLSRLDYELWFCFAEIESSELYLMKESSRRLGNTMAGELKKRKLNSICITDLQTEKTLIYSFVEGLALGSYTFDKYKNKEEKTETIEIYSKQFNKDDAQKLTHVIQSVFKCRDLINEPASYLTTSKFKKEIQDIAEDSRLKIDFFDEAKIATLKMGGIIAVNKGSEEPPFMAIATWKPANAVNKKPYIIVGKGITYDSGGYSLKPSEGMLAMKCDMSGAAVTITTLSLLALNEVPVYVVGLIPATDNKVNEKAQVPGDIITMHDGTRVEVLNTDAEGRLILADALSYAKKYKPELVIDIATLTGAAHAAVGKFGMVAAGKNHKAHIEMLQECSLDTYERFVEFPLWDEYADFIKSKIADVKNIGGKYAGAITAAKFLERFTDYPWIHFDIAGTAFYDKEWNYHPAGGTGIGIRLLYDFFTKISQ